MTEKRFTIQDNKIIKDSHKYITEDGYHFSYQSDAEEMCILLNELYEENKKLKKEIDGFIKGIQESARMSAESITKRFQEDYE